VDASGNALASGQTCSSDFPTLNPLQGSLGGLCDAFVTEINPIGAGLVYSTYLGGSKNESADFIAVDTSGSAYAGGWTESDNFPTTPGAFQPTFGGARDVFLAKIAQPPNTPTGARVLIQPTTNVSLTFDDVTSTGTTAVTQASVGPSPPSGFSLGIPATYYDITTTASFSGSVTVCLSYRAVTFPLGAPQLLHYENGAWTNVTTSVDTANQIVCGSVTSFSPFAVFSASYVPSVQPPIATNGSSILKASRGVVPVKFALTLSGEPTCQLPPATISVFRVSGTSQTAVNQSTYLMPSDSGSNFRIDSTNCQYVYNLGTSLLGAGTYLVRINITGVPVGSASFGLQ
jgi:hypothetical protein